MSVRETSLEAYRALGDAGRLQEQEATLMRLVHRHFPLPARFTRKELAAATGWTINVVTGRVFSLVQKGYLTEMTQTRDGGHLLKISESQDTATAQPALKSATEDSHAAEPSVAAAVATQPAAAQVPPMATRGNDAEEDSRKVESATSAARYPAPAAAPEVINMQGRALQVVSEQIIKTWGRDGKAYEYTACSVKEAA